MATDLRAGRVDGEEGKGGEWRGEGRGESRGKRKGVEGKVGWRGKKKEEVEG